MSFDARSRERLEALGRQLPSKLPAPPPPTPVAGEAAPGSRAVDRRHPVETEQDPEMLFRGLMDVSADGSVPPHLLERLRQLEVPPPQNTASGDLNGSGQRPANPGRRRTRTPRPSAGDPEQDLYTAFQQLLLEDDD
ncbi:MULTISPECIES: hypothetical protein [unclassified Cyanobium]|uniref:hypothetical protein n=1 Tax=unclassified Cyanobium TaxID=2627006 RepID=UPI0020CE6863|nr:MULTISPECIES: hypothetical protein [unclassified Cyanobium]MCP9833056.1 hypothetical protein [Cyanobium sp. La Preciosa 7G6]MCP9936081.1 hypothetical protein [Cyanobium sp. Aljojuca 7A6]